MDQEKKCDTCEFSNRSGQNEPCHTCLINPIRYTKWVERSNNATITSDILDFLNSSRT